MLLNPTTKQHEVYIGKTTNILRRMKNHSKQDDPEDWWSIEIVFTINDNTDPLGDCAISYLECLMCQKVKESTSYNLFQDVEEIRGQNPQMPNISKSDKVYFDGLFDNINILSKSLDFDIFLHVKSTHHNKNNIFHVERKDQCYGRVVYIDNKIFILKGSNIYDNKHSNNFKSSYNYRTYKKWVREGTIKNGIFQRDKECSSPSKASSILLKLKSSDGWRELLNNNNKSLEELYR